MIIIGLTGGIGSGKSSVAELLFTLGIPVYITDFEAKRLMNASKLLRLELTELLGEEAYLNDFVNRPFIAKKIFSNRDLLLQVNKIVHPIVRRDFKDWVSSQTSKAVVVESAILFESGLVDVVDKVIVVTATLEQRIARVVLRDQTTEELVRKRIEAQMDDQERMGRSDYVITNNEEDPIIPQLLAILTELALL